LFVTDAFGGFGGIAKFNRDFIAALDGAPDVNQLTVVPRVISEPINERLPEFTVFDRAARGSIVSYARRSARMLVGVPPDVVICGHIHLLPFAGAVARLRGAPLALIIHGIEAWTPTRHWTANRLARSIDHLVSVSRYSARRFESWSGYPAERATVVPNSVALDRFLPGPRDGALVARYGLHGRRVIMTVGRLAPEEKYKGFDEVIDVMPRLLQRCPDLRYLIVGDGGDRERLEAKAASRGLQQEVIFAGRISENEKVAHYNLCDAYVMPSAGEGFGIVLIEAAACGVPVIGSSVDGSQEALLGGELGRLVDPRSPDALVSAVCETLDSAPPRERHSRIGYFDESQFRERVASWIAAVSPKATSPLGAENRQ
jgi:glycosyltransferase involved in cell wall biosynthesis